MKNITPFLLLALLISSCKHKDEINKNALKSKISENSVANSLFPSNNAESGIIQYSAHGISGPTSSYTVFGGDARFYNDPTHSGFLEYVGLLNFGNIQIDTNSYFSSGLNAYAYSNTNWHDSANFVNWGANTSFGITGSGIYDPFQVSFYVPQVIYLNPVSISCDIGNLNYPTISKSNPTVVLNWNVDNNNSQVAVIFYYNGGTSSRIDPLLSSNSFSSFLLTLDNGNYSITPSDVSQFPIGGIVDIYVGRGNDEVVDVNGKEVYVTANTYSKRSYRITQ